MGLLDKVKDKAGSIAEDAKLSEKLGSAKESMKKVVDETSSSIKSYNEEAKELSKPLDGALIRYEVTYVGGLDSVAKAKSGAWGMNVMPDGLLFRVTMTTKDWLTNLDIPYSYMTDIRIEKRTISTGEMLLGAGDSANQEQENNIVIEYTTPDDKREILRVEMLTGVTIFNQAAKCREFMDLLKKNKILDLIQKKSESGSNSGGGDILAQIEKLSKMKESGILSEEEFVQKKEELLAKL